LEQEIDPTPEELGVLSWMERLSFRLVHAMNQGRWKRFWTYCQRTIGAGWIHLATYNLIRVYGLEHIESASHERPILLVANHRSFFDMYAVSTVLFRRTRWRKSLFFPVRGRFFYESPLGLLVNLLMGWWSMYPPIFADSEKRLFDKYSVRRLAQLCHTGAGHVIGFHPEGTRNRSRDPYSYLRAQPGVGKLIKDAAPQVIPVFIAGLGNSLPRQVMGNWTRGEPIRVHFGAQLELAPYLSKKDHVRTYKEIADFVMARIAELGEEDRALYGAKERGKREIATAT
jgi:1-acyl-sn-glycerol-3-phosphate acyltransferase